MIVLLGVLPTLQKFGFEITNYVFALRIVVRCAPVIDNGNVGH